MHQLSPKEMGSKVGTVGSRRMQSAASAVHQLLETEDVHRHDMDAILDSALDDWWSVEMQTVGLWRAAFEVSTVVDDVFVLGWSWLTQRPCSDSITRDWLACSLLS